MNPVITNGFMDPIRPKDIVSPSIKSDELFLSWLADKHTKEFIINLANQSDLGNISSLNSVAKKISGAPIRKPSRQFPASSSQTDSVGPVDQYTAEKSHKRSYPFSLLRRQPISDPISKGSNAEDDLEILEGASSPTSSHAAEKSPSRTTSGKKSKSKDKDDKEITKDVQNTKETSTERNQNRAQTQQQTSDSSTETTQKTPEISRLSLPNINQSNTIQISDQNRQFATIEEVFQVYSTKTPTRSLDQLVDNILEFYSLPKYLFYHMKMKILECNPTMVTANANSEKTFTKHATLESFQNDLWVKLYRPVRGFILKQTNRSSNGVKIDEQNAKVLSQDSMKRFSSLEHRQLVIFNLLIEDNTRDYIVPSDWVLLILGLLEEHPGLNLIRDEVEYQQRYLDTVITRIHFGISRNHRNKIYFNEFSSSNIIECIEQLGSLNDITNAPQYFDYMSYFVIYSKFTELDIERNWKLSNQELASYSNHSITQKVIDKVFFHSRFLPRANMNQTKWNGNNNNNTNNTTSSDNESNVDSSMTSAQQNSSSLVETVSSCGVPLAFLPNNRFSFQDFAWFILCEEDKTHINSIRFWFNILDNDEDGFWSPTDLFYFYEEQMFRMEYTVMDIVPFEDAMVQIIDMVKPKNEQKISLNEIKKSGFASEIFNLLFNLDKFRDDEKLKSLESISANMNAKQAKNQIPAWELFASNEYLTALAETVGNDDDDDYEDENMDIWVEVATDINENDSNMNTSGGSSITPRDY